MIELTLVGVNCTKCWRMEDKLIQMSREVGIPVQIRKVMNLDEILRLGLPAIPALTADGQVWEYDEVMRGGTLKQILIGLDEGERIT